MLGGVSRITLENATLEVERVNNAIDDRLRKRGVSVAEFRQKFFEFGLKCIEVLNAHERKFDEKRNHAAHDATGRREDDTAVLQNILDRRGRLLCLIRGHRTVSKGRESGADSSAGDPDEFDDVPFRPCHRAITIKDVVARRAANVESARRFEAEYVALNRAAANTTPVTPKELTRLSAQCAEECVSAPVYFAIDFASAETDMSVHFAYRDGKAVLLDRKAAQHSPRTGA
ncbi:hypothetical protein SAMN05414139_04519 [Burkholderia sp. D7]|nr:hypothetical protein SAMN05414139_04519 [Burkholderia sp. D7]